VPYNADFYLLADDEACPICADEAARDLAFIGLDRVGGWFGMDGLDAARVAGRRLRTLQHVSVEEVARSAARGDFAIVDVRGRSEWIEGHLPGVPNIPLGYLTEHTDQLPRDRPLVLQCRSGARSAIGVSLLQARGFDNVSNMEGGFAAWSAEGHPVEREEPAPVD
ncbi:MAG: rhodanese-like domain-containing protein, partial [Longimicrobiales bacterium]